ncbi:MAG: alpha/beta hydrolase [Rickettsiales bacterium]|jgi:pimeloyl-ACP methyl ester carboxylesterase|nr:alpha/beta hydrolase [Rickettsiales bacterium]
MKKIILPFLISACAYTLPPGTTDVQTSGFVLRTYQKLSDDARPVKFYLEGDGYAFNAAGDATSDPTPRGDFMQSLALNDASANVVYLARPCQYVRDPECRVCDWTDARFSEKAVNSAADAIKKIAGARPVILIGFSGGAQIAGLVAVMHPEIRVKKLITISGNLDHPSWTREKNLAPLAGSLDLNNYRAGYKKIPQTHYVGTDDAVIPPRLTTEFAGAENVVIIPGAGHGKGFESIYPLIWKE